MVFLFSYFFSPVRWPSMALFFFKRGLTDGDEGTRRSCHHCCRRNVRGLFNLQQLSHARERPETPNRCFSETFSANNGILVFKDLSDPDQPISIESDPVFGN